MIKCPPTLDWGDLGFAFINTREDRTWTLTQYTAHSITLNNDDLFLCILFHYTTNCVADLPSPFPARGFISTLGYSSTRNIISLNVWTPCWTLDGAHNRLASQGQRMYHSGHNDLIYTLALSHSDQLPQVTVTLVKRDNHNPFLDHPESLGPPTAGVDKRKKEKIYMRIILPVEIDAHKKLVFSWTTQMLLIDLYFLSLYQLGNGQQPEHDYSVHHYGPFPCWLWYIGLVWKVALLLRWHIYDYGVLLLVWL